MYAGVLLLFALAASVLGEPPVPQGQYGAPSSQYGAPSSQSGAPSSQYGAPSSQYGAPSSQSGAPSSQYGAPGSGNHGGYSSGGPGGFSPGGGYGNGKSGNNDIAQFTHEQDFQRTPGVIWGQYTVALPDGRTQKVEYDADESGFHPVITFEDPRDQQGYGQGGSSGY